jgi:hypothetical protein
VVASGAAPPGLVGEGQVTVHRATPTLHQNIIVLRMMNITKAYDRFIVYMYRIPSNNPFSSRTQASILTQKTASENCFFAFFLHLMRWTPEKID